jgi:hypothetical protein
MRFDRGSVKIYSKISKFCCIFFILANITLIIVSGFHSIYTYVISIINPSLLLINIYFFRNSVDGIFGKSNHKILKKKERLIGKKAIFTGLLSFILFIIVLSLFIYFELWIIYWMFYIK